MNHFSWKLPFHFSDHLDIFPSRLRIANVRQRYVSLPLVGRSSRLGSRVPLVSRHSPVGSAGRMPSGWRLFHKETPQRGAPLRRGRHQIGNQDETRRRHYPPRHLRTCAHRKRKLLQTKYRCASGGEGIRICGTVAGNGNRDSGCDGLNNGCGTGGFSERLTTVKIVH